MLHFIHPDDVILFDTIKRAMEHVARDYNLPLRSITPMPAPKAPIQLGDCSIDGHIRLVMRFLHDGEWTEARHEDDVWRTAAHELAHLRHFNHGVQFQEFEEEMRLAISHQREDHRQRIIDKLVKMQAQRDSEAKIGNAAAAEAFAGMINRMLIEYELNPTDLDYARATDRDPVIEIRVDLTKYRIDKVKRRVAWQESLARVVAKAHLCSFLVVKGTNQIIFVGTRAHALVAEYAFGVLVPAAHDLSIKERLRYSQKRIREGANRRDIYGFREAWLSAFVQRIAERFDEARKEAVETNTVNPGDHTTALVRLNGAMTKVQEHIDAKFGKKRRYASALNGGSSHNADGRAWGRAAADRMPIGRRGITASTGTVRGLLK